MFLYRCRMGLQGALAMRESFLHLIRGQVIGLLSFEAIGKDTSSGGLREPMAHHTGMRSHWHSSCLHSLCKPIQTN